ncbi:hypothetical protein SynSYN20_01019 [Synechococcus sp. SYN20]|nr:hypothetical protein SynSYN20_01019 [Synechococcus sp. SYN20]
MGVLMSTPPDLLCCFFLNYLLKSHSNHGRNPRSLCQSAIQWHGGALRGH